MISCFVSLQLLKVFRKVLGASLFNLMMRSTFYGHFVAGADQDEIKPKVTKMKEFGVKSILDYSAEEDISSEQAAEAMNRSVVNHLESSLLSLELVTQKKQKTIIYFK